MCLEVKNLAFSFNKSLLVENLDFKIEKNEVGLVAGASGIGKSTLLNITYVPFFWLYKYI